jgi:hypothetical protein
LDGLQIYRTIVVEIEWRKYPQKRGCGFGLQARYKNRTSLHAMRLES